MNVGNLMTSMWTGVSGLRVNQTALNTTSHNISNIDTKGYTRQQILLTDTAYNNIGMSHISTYQIGLGSGMQAIRQVRDVFLDKSYRLESGRMNFYQVQSDAATEIETIFGEFGDSTFATSIDDLWSAINGVAEEPDSIVRRSLLASRASTFISYAKLLSEQLQKYQQEVNGKIQSQVDRINQIGDSIKELNKVIMHEEVSGQNANDYRDSRNMLLDELGSYVNITYSEDLMGQVTVNIEGSQFVTQDRVYHMKTVDVPNEEKQAMADKMNGLIKDLMGEIAKNPGGGTAAMDQIRASAPWKELAKYGDIGITAANGEYTVTFNEIQLIKTTDGIMANSDVVNYEASPTGFQNVIWENTGFDVFRLTGNYASYNNTDVGSLKSTIIARGNLVANYTDIPQRADYCDAKGNFLSQQKEDEYNEAVAKFNKDLNACLLTSTQAQLDLLVHDIVTTINDVLCPNVKLEASSINSLLGANGATATNTAINNAVIRTENGVFNLNDDLMILDIVNTSVGMDPDETMGEAIFNRKSKDRYTEAVLEIEYTDANGVTHKPGDPNYEGLKVYVYNKEYETDVHSMFTISQIEVNQKILDDVSKMPLSYNKYSELYGGFDYDRCQKILDLWGTDSIQLSPNTTTPYNFTDYYDAIAGNIGTVGGVYAEKLSTLEQTVFDVGDKRESILGVASEEELTNLIMFQNAYNASSRYINAINELLENVINIGR